MMCQDNLSQDTMFGLRDGKIFHISEIAIEEKGLKCNCVCPKCNEPLIARMGDIRQHYFAHHNKSECSGALESALHLFAKEVLKKNKKLLIPEVKINYKIENNKVKFIKSKDSFSDFNTEIISYEKDVYFDKIQTEKTVEGIIPDVILQKNKRILFLEIKVTHKVDSLKKEKIKKMKISTIEVDLSKEFKNYYEFDRKLVGDGIINKLETKEWIYNYFYEKNKKRLKKRLEDEIDRKLQKENELLVLKIKNNEQKRKKKIEQIEFLIDTEYQKNLKLVWDRELCCNYFWQRAARNLGIIKDTIPPYLNREIKGELIFNCDRRIWQSELFSVFIHKWRTRNPSYNKLSIEYLVSWVKNKSKLPLNRCLLYTKDVESEIPNIPSLSEVIFDFMKNLEEFNFVKPTEKSLRINGNHYYWWFQKNDEDLKIVK